MTSVAIVQSSYIPWKGYFDLINIVDEFVLFDDAQFTRRDWRSRNAIMTANGPQWLTIPVSGGSQNQRINEVEVADAKWRNKHWNTIRHSYSKAPFFREIETWLAPLYLERDDSKLSDINTVFIKAINTRLGIKTSIRNSSEFELREGRNERLIGICTDLGADRYVSGPAAKEYMDVSSFEAEGIDVEWMDYTGYPEYPQRHEPFEHAVSIIDLLFNTGPDAVNYMKSFQEDVA